MVAVMTIRPVKKPFNAPTGSMQRDTHRINTHCRAPDFCVNLVLLYLCVFLWWICLPVSFVQRSPSFGSARYPPHHTESVGQNQRSTPLTGGISSHGHTYDCKIRSTSKSDNGGDVGNTQVGVHTSSSSHGTSFIILSKKPVQTRTWPGFIGALAAVSHKEALGALRKKTDRWKERDGDVNGKTQALPGSAAVVLPRTHFREKQIESTPRTVLLGQNMEGGITATAENLHGKSTTSVSSVHQEVATADFPLSKQERNTEEREERPTGENASSTTPSLSTGSSSNNHFGKHTPPATVTNQNINDNEKNSIYEAALFCEGETETSVKEHAKSSARESGRGTAYTTQAVTKESTPPRTSSSPAGASPTSPFLSLEDPLGSGKRKSGDKSALKQNTDTLGTNLEHKWSHFEPIFRIAWFSDLHLDPLYDVEASPEQHCRHKDAVAATAAAPDALRYAADVYASRLNYMNDEYEEERLAEAAAIRTETHLNHFAEPSATLGRTVYSVLRENTFNTDIAGAETAAAAGDANSHTFEAPEQVASVYAAADEKRRERSAVAVAGSTKGGLPSQDNRAVLPAHQENDYFTHSRHYDYEKESQGQEQQGPQNDRKESHHWNTPREEGHHHVLCRRKMHSGDQSTDRAKARIDDVKRSSRSAVEANIYDEKRYTGSPLHRGHHNKTRTTRQNSRSQLHNSSVSSHEDSGKGITNNIRHSASSEKMDRGNIYPRVSVTSRPQAERSATVTAAEKKITADEAAAKVDCRDMLTAEGTIASRRHATTGGQTTLIEEKQEQKEGIFPNVSISSDVQEELLLLLSDSGDEETDVRLGQAGCDTPPLLLTLLIDSIINVIEDGTRSKNKSHQTREDTDPDLVTSGTEERLSSLYSHQKRREETPQSLRLSPHKSSSSNASGPSTTEAVVAASHIFLPSTPAASAVEGSTWSRPSPSFGESPPPFTGASPVLVTEEASSSARPTAPGGFPFAETPSASLSFNSSPFSGDGTLNPFHPPVTRSPPHDAETDQTMKASSTPEQQRISQASRALVAAMPFSRLWDFLWLKKSSSAAANSLWQQRRERELAAVATPVQQGSLALSAERRRQQHHHQTNRKNHHREPLHHTHARHQHNMNDASQRRQHESRENEEHHSATTSQQQDAPSQTIHSAEARRREEKRESSGCMRRNHRQHMDGSHPEVASRPPVEALLVTGDFAAHYGDFTSSLRMQAIKAASATLFSRFGVALHSASDGNVAAEAEQGTSAAGAAAANKKATGVQLIFAVGNNDLPVNYYIPDHLNTWSRALYTLWRGNVLPTDAETKEVLIVGHVPPGITHHFDTRLRRVQQWRKQYLVRYRALVSQYADVILAHLYGHVHADTVKMLATQSAVEPRAKDNTRQEENIRSPSSAVTGAQVPAMSASNVPAATVMSDVPAAPGGFVTATACAAPSSSDSTAGAGVYPATVAASGGDAVSASRVTSSDLFDVQADRTIDLCSCGNVEYQPLLTCPAISPIHGNNPAWRTLLFGRRTFPEAAASTAAADPPPEYLLLDHSQYYLPIYGFTPIHHKSTLVSSAFSATAPTVSAGVPASESETTRLAGATTPQKATRLSSSASLSYRTLRTYPSDFLGAGATFAANLPTGAATAVDAENIPAAAGSLLASSAFAARFSVPFPMPGTPFDDRAYSALSARFVAATVGGGRKLEPSANSCDAAAVPTGLSKKMLNFLPEYTFSNTYELKCITGASLRYLAELLAYSPHIYNTYERHVCSGGISVTNRSRVCEAFVSTPQEYLSCVHLSAPTP